MKYEPLKIEMSSGKYDTTWIKIAGKSYSKSMVFDPRKSRYTCKHALQFWDYNQQT